MMNTKPFNNIRHTKWILILAAVASIVLAVVTLLNVILVNNTLMRQTKTIGETRISRIADELQSTIDTDKYMLSNLSEETQETLSAGVEASELADFFDMESARQKELSGGSCQNVFLVQGSLILLPGLDLGEDFDLTSRIWYEKTLETAPGEFYISPPYTDLVTGNICFTITRLLDDGETIVGMDFDLATVQDYILEMQSDNKGQAWIIDQNGLVVGSSDETILGENLLSVYPKMEQAAKAVTECAPDGSADTVKNGSSTYFCANIQNNWYLIFEIDSKEFYQENYRQLMRNTVLNLLMIAVLVVLFIIAWRSRRKAERALQAKEEFLSGLSGELHAPLDRIQSSSSLENSMDIAPEKRMEIIRESVGELSEMLNNLFSYSGLTVKKQKERKEKKEKIQDAVLEDRFSGKIKTGVTVILLIAMLVTMTLDGILVAKMGSNAMLREAESYKAEISEWMQVQQNVINQMVFMLQDTAELWESEDKLSTFLHNCAERNEDILTISVAAPDEEWKMIASDSSSTGADVIVQAYSWYIDAVAEPGSVVISDPWYDTQTGVYCVTFSRTVTGADGETSGVLAVDFYLDQLTDLLEKNYTSDQYAFMTNRNGIIINHPNQDYQLTAASSVNISELDYAEVYSENGQVKNFKDYDGVYKSCVSLKDDVSGFTILLARNWWSTYKEMVIYWIIILLMFGVCIFAVNFLVRWLITWQGKVKIKLKESADLANQATQAKSKFLAQMSHEIRTPINAVIGMDEMILRECDDPDIRGYAADIGNAGHTLLALINSILDFSKIEDGRMEIVPVEYRTKDLIHDLYTMTIDRAEKKNLIFQMEIDEKLPSKLFGDDVRVRQVIVNLLTNAVKYTPQGSVVLKIEERERADDQITIFVSVTDTGIGIRQEDMEKLFQSFQRLDQEQNHNIEGTGLGISIVSSLLEMMDSKLLVESEYGKGSVFSFQIRQKIVDPSPIGSIADDHQSQTEENREGWLYAPDAKLMVVDDNKMNLKVVKGLLKRSQCQLTLCNSGMEAVSRIQKEHFDVLFMDHMMPEMDGIQTLHKMKEEHLLPEDTVPIVLTANAIAGAKEEYLAAGFSDYLSKPIIASDLEEMLFQYLPPEKAGRRYPDDEPIPEKTSGQTGQITSQNTDGNTSENDSQNTQESTDTTNSIDTTANTENTENTHAEKEESQIERLAALLDVNTGLQYCMGSEEFYLEMIQEYLDNNKSGDMSTFFEQENWENYRITVHALKSTSLTIGAADLSEQAKQLEMAAKEENYDYIRTNHADVLEKYQKLCGELQQIVKMLSK